MRKGFKVMAAVLALVLVGSLFTGCHHRHGHHGDPEKMAKKLEKHIDKVLTRIDATDDQKRRINLITGQIVEDAKQTRKQSAGEHGAVIASLLSDQPDSEWLHRQVDEKAEAMTEFGHRTVERLIEINAILTPEQRAELLKRFESAHGSQKR